MAGRAAAMAGSRFNVEFKYNCHVFNCHLFMPPYMLWADGILARQNT